MAEFAKFSTVVTNMAKMCAGNMDHKTAAAFLMAQQKLIQDKSAEARRAGGSGAKAPVSGGQQGNPGAKAAAAGGMARLQAMLSKK